MFEALKNITSLHGISGREQQVLKYIQQQITPFVDKVYSDTLGNLVAVKKGSGPRIMIMANIDEIGLISTFIDENGFVRAAPVGKFEVAGMINKTVTFENGVRGIFALGDKVEIKNAGTSDCYIDIFAKDRREALNMIDIGMSAKFDSIAFETENIVVSGALNNRLGCYVLMEVIKSLKEFNGELYFVFTSQKEIGLRGAKVSGFEISPDLAIAVDVTRAAQTPDSSPACCRLGGGAAIKIRDAGVVCTASVVEALESTAKENDIKYQRDVRAKSDSDIAAVQAGGRGVKVGAVSIPIRYCHTSVECANKDDIDSAIRLLSAFIQKGIETSAEI